jgi:CheY-like chemotaxis protein
MDIQMPGMDGLEAIRRIRADKTQSVATVSIIALTALGMPGDRERCLQAGANEYLSKPISLKELAKVIEKQLT